jgi:transcription factor S
MFCPKCGSILRPKMKGGKKIIYCGSCDYTKDSDGEKIQISEKVDLGKKIEVVKDSVDMLPKVRTKCGKCENEAAYYWTQQTRSADEPETRFFKCTKCGHTWREY